MNCPNCGERLTGDGYSTVLHCPNADTSWQYAEPDAAPIYCDVDTFINSKHDKLK